MAEKEDFYKVLGVAKTATAEQIKAAHKSIMMKNHPDMVKNRKYPDDAAKQKALDDASAIFKAATEAEGVLSDPLKRETYDRYGHKGIENLNAGKSGASGQSYEQVAGPVVRKSYTEEDTLSFFEKRAERTRAEEGTPGDGMTTEQRREKARQDRIAKRGTGNSSSTPATTVPMPGSAINVFHDVATKVSDVADKLKTGDVAVPLADLEEFRASLTKLENVVDQQIARAKRGPRP